MSEYAIRVEGLAKRYRIGAKQESYRTLRDSVASAATWPYRAVRSAFTRTAEDDDANQIWAVKDLSFQVEKGEVIGVIGRNGAGKSTLLKILSRVTEPTLGYAEVRGRVGSLLEVGTGFHPELTGRENISLNGAILGMTRHEIRRKFDEIVAFSGIETFIETPVKFYSSGMYLRLAFAVAAHFEPEILLVDEVLAVGDLEFQKRCVGRLSDVAREGRTVLFVSHNLTAISKLTERCVLLQDGKVLKCGPTDDIIADYHASIIAAQNNLAERTDRKGTGQVRFTRVELLDGRTGQPVSSIPVGQSLKIRLYWDCHEKISTKDAAFDIRINDSLGVPVASLSTRFRPVSESLLPASGCSECHVPELPLAPDSYTFDVWAGAHDNQADYLSNAGSLAVRNFDYYGTGHLPSIRKHGGFLIHHEWQVHEGPPPELSPGKQLPKIEVTQ